MTEFADQFRVDIAAIDALQPVAETSDRVRVMTMAASIKKAVDRGVTWAAIEECLRGLGITAALPAIRNYVRAAGVQPPSRRPKATSTQNTRRNSTLGMEAAFPKPTKIKVSNASVGESHNQAPSVEAAFPRLMTMKGGGASVEQIRPDSDDL